VRKTKPLSGQTLQYQGELTKSFKQFHGNATVKKDYELPRFPKHLLMHGVVSIRLLLLTQLILPKGSFTVATFYASRPLSVTGVAMLAALEDIFVIAIFQY
jgi:hypothetical protein